MNKNSKKINWASGLGKALPVMALAMAGGQCTAASGSGSRSRMRSGQWIQSSQEQVAASNGQSVFNGFSVPTSTSESATSADNSTVKAESNAQSTDSHNTHDAQKNAELQQFLKQLKQTNRQRQSFLSGDLNTAKANPNFISRSRNPELLGKTRANGSCYFTGGFFSYCSSAPSQMCTTDADCNFAGDSTPPNFQSSTPSQNSVNDTQVVIDVDIDEAGTAFAVVVADGDGAPSSIQVRSGQNSSSGAAIASSSVSLSGGGFSGTITLTGLTAGTAYDVYVVAQDDEGTPNLQLSPSLVNITTTSSPEINLQGNAVSIADGDTTPSATDDTDFGSHIVGGSNLTRTFTIQNTGTGALDLTDTPNVAISGSGDFSISAQPGSDPVSAASSTTFQVTLDPTTVGVQSATISIANDDSDENPYNFDIQATISNPDTDGDLTASATVTEPVGLDTTADTVGEAVDIFDFTLSDGGGGDGLPMEISQIVVNVSGTSTDTERGQVTWRIDGADASNVTGVYAANTITFSGLSISVAEGGNETYTINAYYNDNTGLTEDLTFILSVDGDTDVTTSASGTSMGATTAVTNGAGTTVDVVATALAFTTQPAGSVSGSALTTQPVVTAQDAFGNTDVDFSETITVTEASAGSLVNGTASAVSGVATFGSLTYTATADQQGFTLTANDQDAMDSDLPTTDANSVTADVVATALNFNTEPSPLLVSSGQSTAFSTVPVVEAVDASGVVDTGYSTDITLSEVNGAGAAALSGTGDTDGNGATVSITPSSGVSTFTGLNITYTASGGSSETFNLQASSGGLTTADSSQLTGLVPDNDGNVTAGSGVSEPVALNYSEDTVGEAVDLFDFTISDGATADGLALTVSAITLDVSGSSSDTERGNITWRLNGNDASNVTGVYNAGADTLTFSGLSISVADGANETYTINGYYNSTSGLTHANTVILSVDGDTDFTVGSTGTQMGSTSAVTNGTGTVITDDAAPEVSSVSVPANATYMTGENLDFTVNFDEAVTVNTGGGTPLLNVTVGSTARTASYVSGSGTSALVFRHTVVSGDEDSDGIALGATIDPNSGTLQDSAGNDINTTLNSVGSLAAVLVDAVAPTLSEVTVVTTPGNNSTPNYTFSTSEAGTLAVGGSCGSGEEGAVSSGNNTIALTQTDNTTALADGTYSDCTATVTDSAGNASSALSITSFTIDTAAPSGQAVSFDDSDINGTEASSQNFTFAGGEIGSTYNYTISSSGGGTNVTGSGTLATATDQITGLDLSGLGDGTLTLSVTLTDTAGNTATAVTDTATLDASAPSGHSVSFDDATINSTEASSQSFTFASGEVGATYDYTVSSSGGGTDVTGSGTLTTATDQITGLDLSGLGDGTLTLSVILTDTSGNAATAVTDTATLDTAAPSGQSVSFDDATINSTEASSQSFTFAAGEVGATYDYTVSSSGGGTNVTGSGTLTTATDQITGLDLSGLSDGTLTLSVVLTDTAGNAATAVTDTATLDTAAPSGQSVSFDDASINSTEASSQSFTFAGGEIGSTYNFTISSSGGGTNVTGSGTLTTATDQITGLDLSGLGDGTLTLSVTLTDTAGNIATAVTDTATLDASAPSGHSVSFDDDTINSTEAGSQSFTFASGEVGATYDYTISSSGGGTNVTGSGTLTTATDQITGLDLSGLGDGTLTLSVILTDTAGNAATAVTDTTTLDTAAPSGQSVSFDDATINSTEASSQSFTFASGEVGATYDYTVSSSGGGTDVTGSGTLTTATDQITGLDLSGLGDGTLTLSVILTDTAGNTATAVTDTATLDTAAPSGQSVSFDDATINGIEAGSQSFTFAAGEVGATYDYTISSSGGGTNVTGSGTLTTATDQITGLDLSGLGDGTLTLSVTLTDTAGNTATAVTDTATLDASAPSGHSVSFDDATINSTEASSQNFTFASGEVGATYDYTVSSSGGGTNVTGSGTLTTATDQITGLDLSGLGDGTLTLSVILTDTAGNAATAVTDTATLDTTAPSGQSVSFDDATINSTEASSQSFTFAAGEVGATYDYTVSSSGGGTDVTGSGTLTTATDQITGLDLSGLSDGTLTLSVVLTDTTGNAASAVTDTATLDTSGPSGQSVSFDDSDINGTEASSQSFTFAAGEVGATYDYTISSTGGGTNVTGSGTLATATDQITGLDLSGLGDGTLTLSVTLTDTAGNTATAVTDTATLDASAPSGHSVSFDDATINSTEAGSQSFTFASGEMGATYDYTVSSSGGGTDVTGSGTLTTATDQVTGLDLSSLNDGTLTLSVVVTDTSGNAATAVTDTAELDATAPALTSSDPGDDSSALRFDADLTLNFSESISAGSSGATSISLFAASDDSLIESIAADSTQVAVSTTQVVVSLTDDLEPATDYYLQIGSDAFVDAAGNSYSGISDQTTLNFTTTNLQPTAGADTATTNEDNAVAINVLANDTDQDGSLNAASVMITSAVSNGSTSVNTGTGVVTYTPDSDFNGTDTFSYTVEDNNSLASNAVTVTINVNPVNDAPVAVADMASTDEDTATSIDVAANDTDIDSGDAVDATTISIVTGPNNGSALVSGGLVDYTPSANFNGTDTFTYTIEDGNGAASGTAMVTINVMGVNDLPEAADDTATVDEDQSVAIDLHTNDTDIDGTVDETTVMVQTTPANGSTAVDSVTGIVTYTPNADFNGSDTFTYTVRDDADGTSNEASVSVTVNSVNDAPVATNDTASLLEDVPHTINVLGNDSDVDGTLDATSIEVVTAPANGAAAVSAGSIVYTPSEHFNGTDSFTYRVSDELAEFSTPATVTITVEPVNDEPLANADSFTLAEDTEATLDILANDSDIDGTLDVSSITIVSEPNNGLLIDNGDGTLAYTPDLNFNGSDLFIYRVADDEGAETEEQVVSLTITPVNDEPTISGSPALNVVQGQNYSFAPILDDIEGSGLTVTASNLPSWLMLDSTTGVLSGVATIPGSFSDIGLQVSDGELTASLAPFTINVALDTDGDGIANSEDPDDDNDGITDDFENSVGLNPLDSTDAVLDSDDDTINNLQEFLDGTDPNDALDYFDVTEPTVSAPDEITVDAVALFTPVTTRQLLGLPATSDQSEIDAILDTLATDNVDGADCCNPDIVNVINNAVLLRPGRNLVTYRATDRMGNVGEDQQVVNVRPLVSVNRDIVATEGGTATLRIILNGPAPFYPLTVPFVVDAASSADSSDHDLVDGTVTFNQLDGTGETERSVIINLADDQIAEPNEQLLVRLDDRTSNSEDLTGFDPDNPNIFDINSGAKTLLRINIVEGNVAPKAQLRLTQGSRDTIQVTAAGGPVSINAAVTDPNPGDTVSFDWSASANSLVDTDGNLSNNQLLFDPSELSSGRYRAEVTVTDSQGASDTARLFFVVVARLPVLSNLNDTDNDGIGDEDEGTADTDDDGIPDYLDNIPAENVLPEVARETNSFLVECDPGVRCRLGQFALVGNSGGVRLDNNDIEEQEDLFLDDLVENTGGIFDFEMHDLPTLGQSVSVVLPQQAAIPENAIYRKFHNGQWQTFVIDDNNQVHSAPGNLGFCPPPGDDSFEPGLIAGYLCVQLTIEDGGPNDADNAVNGSVEDPGGVGIDLRSPNSVTSNSSGSGAVGWWLMVLSAGLLVHGLRRKNYRHSHGRGTALMIWPALLCAGLLINSLPVAADWQTIKANSYVNLSVYNAENNQSAEDFLQGFENTEIEITLTDYETNRTAYQFAFGYQYHPALAVEVGYLDLGDNDVNFDSLALSDEELADIVEENYPISGNGLTVVNQFGYNVNSNIQILTGLGFFVWQGDIDASLNDIDRDLDGGVDPIINVTAQYTLKNKVAFQLHAKRIIFDQQNVTLFGLGVNYHLK